MGVAGLAALGAETVTYFALPQLSRLTSHHMLMLCCLLLVVIRYFLYGILQSPWWLVVPECFKGNTTQRQMLTHRQVNDSSENDQNKDNYLTNKQANTQY